MRHEKIIENIRFRINAFNPEQKVFIEERLSREGLSRTETALILRQVRRIEISIYRSDKNKWLYSQIIDEDGLIC